MQHPVFIGCCKISNVDKKCFEWALRPEKVYNFLLIHSWNNTGVHLFASYLIADIEYHKETNFLL